MPKIICQECGRTYNSRCFHFNKLKNKKICRLCNNRIGNNILYEPKIRGAIIKKKRRIYFLQKDEQDFLYKDKTKQGIDNKQIKESIMVINAMVRNINQKREERQEQSETNKRFLEGLR